MHEVSQNKYVRLSPEPTEPTDGQTDRRCTRHTIPRRQGTAAPTEAVSRLAWRSDHAVRSLRHGEGGGGIDDAQEKNSTSSAPQRCLVDLAVVAVNVCRGRHEGAATSAETEAAGTKRFVDTVVFAAKEKTDLLLLLLLPLPFLLPLSAATNHTDFIGTPSASPASFK